MLTRARSKKVFEHMKGDLLDYVSGIQAGGRLDADVSFIDYIWFPEKTGEVSLWIGEKEGGRVLSIEGFSGHYYFNYVDGAVCNDESGVCGVYQQTSSDNLSFFCMHGSKIVNVGDMHFNMNVIESNGVYLVDVTYEYLRDAAPKWVQRAETVFDDIGLHLHESIDTLISEPESNPTPSLFWRFVDSADADFIH